MTSINYYNAKLIGPCPFSKGVQNGDVALILINHEVKYLLSHTEGLGTHADIYKDPNWDRYERFLYVLNNCHSSLDILNCNVAMQIHPIFSEYLVFGPSVAQGYIVKYFLKHL